MTAVAAPTVPPGPTLSRVQMISFLRSPATFLDGLRAEHGDVFSLRMPGAPPLVVLADPAAIRDVFTGSTDVLMAGVANQPLGTVLGPRSTLLLDGEEHLRARRRLLPPFHGERMKAYERVMERAALREIEGWPVGRPFALLGSMQEITLEVIMRAVFGVAAGDRYEQLSQRIRLMLAPASRVQQAMRVLRPSDELPKRFAQQIDDVDELIHAELHDRRAASDLDTREDVLSMLVQAGLTDEELRDEVMTLLVAGHETTATALAWAFERVLRHPDVLERLPEDTPYLDAVIKETLRARPVVGSVGRWLSAPYVVAGWELPAGTLVMPSIGLSHRREEAFPDHDAFRPERFLGEDAPTGYEWLPFGGGPRRCPGAAFAQFEMRVVMRTILRSVTLRADRAAGEDATRMGIITAPARGARVVRVA